VFASVVDQVIIVRLTADTPRRLNFSATFETPQKATVSTIGKSALLLRGVNGDAFGIKGGLKFEARAVVIAAGGEIVAENDKNRRYKFKYGRHCHCSCDELREL
jgi:alpha-L-fucosidase 2